MNAHRSQINVASTAVDGAHEQFKNTKVFSALNGIRALCCLMVIKEHSDFQIPWPQLISNGWVGVDIFFGISGFLIVTLMIREREARGSVNLRNFYARRSLRIFPIYYLLIFISFFFFLLISPWKPRSLRLYLPAFAVLLTYTQDFISVPLGGFFFHTWSLAMEEHFYLMWPLVERYAVRPLRWTILMALIVLNQLVNHGCFDDAIRRHYGNDMAINMSVFLITFTPILLGVVLAYALHARQSFELLRRLIGYRWSPLLILATLFVYCEIAPQLVRGTPRLGLHVLFLLLLGSLVIREDHAARTFLTWRPLARIGVISYGVYLYHLWVLTGVRFAKRILHLDWMGAPLVFVVVTLGSIAVAEMSYRLLEQPLLRVKARFHS